MKIYTYEEKVIIYEYPNVNFEYKISDGYQIPDNI